MLNKRISAVLLATIYLAVGYYGASAQLVTSDKNRLPRNYLIKVKQFNEFIDRFNYQKDFLNQDIGPAFSDKITRQGYIGLLFNNTPDNKMQGNSLPDTLIANFIQAVCRDSLFIDKYSESVFAELKCRFTVNDKNIYIPVLMKQEIDHGLKWSFVSVHREYSAAKNKDVEAGHYLNQGIKGDQPDYIPPLSNETNFIVLKEILTNKNNLGIYTARHHNPGRMNDFYYAVSTGELKFRYVESITYFVFDIPGWVMIVRNFQRDTANSGWLIAELERVSGDSYPDFREKFGLDRFK